MFGSQSVGPTTGPIRPTDKWVPLTAYAIGLQSCEYIDPFLKKDFESRPKLAVCLSMCTSYSLHTSLAQHQEARKRWLYQNGRTSRSTIPRTSRQIYQTRKLKVRKPTGRLTRLPHRRQLLAACADRSICSALRTSGSRAIEIKLESTSSRTSTLKEDRQDLQVASLDFEKRTVQLQGMDDHFVRRVLNSFYL
jgi:hypothetical protein